MATLNNVNLIGHLTRDVEIRVTPKGTSIGQFSLAVNRKYQDDKGQEVNEVTYVDIEAWGKQAELVSKYTKKGSLVFVQGRLKMDSWEDKETKQKRSRLKIVLENVQFLSSNGATEGAAPAARPAAGKPARPAATQAPATPEPTASEDEDVPF